MLDKLEIGYITSTHGLKGEVNVYPTTDEPERFRGLSRVIVQTGAAETIMEVERTAFFKGKPILKLAGVDRIEDAQKLRGSTLLVSREDAIPLLEGEYFIGDHVGSAVYLEDGSEFGTLSDIFRTGANDVYVIDRREGGITYIPAVREFVTGVDPVEKRITVRIMKEI